MTSPVAGIAAAATSGGIHTALVGLPRFGLLAAAEMGASLPKLAYIPDPGPDPLEIIRQLVDGIGLVIAGPMGLDVAPSKTRAIVARVRTHDCALLLTGGIRWPGTELHITTSIKKFHGIGHGTGRLTSTRFAVEARDKSGIRYGEIETRPVTEGRMQWTGVEDAHRPRVRIGAGA
ncbi:hypothetical protein [Nocardia transvalensis]|uniref:hypothetical protein n=1 Tax=Nocardia transvalensis TaxID=37333 RepID=UPI0018954BD7|nr:hypothetical protein [Nocardia transvalensis]MBF6333551.1 hypothetical protein [Nocardia transvalensis]